MARQRRNDTETTTEQESKVSTVGAFTALSPEDIQGLLAKSKQRGQYDEQMGNFLRSGDQGIQVSLETGPFAEKKPNSVKTGFEGAKKRLNDKEENSCPVRVIVNEDSVYLIRTDV